MVQNIKVGVMRMQRLFAAAMAAALVLAGLTAGHADGWGKKEH